MNYSGALIVEFEISQTIFRYRYNSWKILPKYNLFRRYNSRLYNNHIACVVLDKYVLGSFFTVSSHKLKAFFHVIMFKIGVKNSHLSMR